MGVSHAGSKLSLSVFVRSLTPMSVLDRLTARFEIAVENFFRSAFDLQVNEAAYQAWYAASVIAEFGLSKVYREVHLIRSQLADLVSPEIVVGFEKGNELVPDLSVSWEEAIDARHTQARPPEPKVFVHGNPETDAIWSLLSEALAARGVDDGIRTLSVTNPQLSPKTTFTSAHNESLMSRCRRFVDRTGMGHT